MSKPQPLNCPSLCEIQKEFNIARGAPKAGANAQYNNCMSQCTHNQSNPQTPWPCLLASPSLTPTAFDARVNQCQSQLPK